MMQILQRLQRLQHLQDTPSKNVIFLHRATVSCWGTVYLTTFAFRKRRNVICFQISWRVLIFKTHENRSQIDVRKRIHDIVSYVFICIILYIYIIYTLIQHIQHLSTSIKAMQNLIRQL